MSSFSALKTAIQAAIKQNGNNEITGDILQDILLSIVSTLGDSAINTLEQGLQTESQTRGNDDAALSQAIENEATARGNQDTQLGNLIIGIKNNIDNGYVYAGIATPSTTPVSGKVFYIATQAGTYTNLGNTAVKPGISILKYNGSAWSNEQVIYTDGGVFDVSAYNGGATYASLEALLSDANLSTIIPSAVRKGGMIIRYVQTSDNKYVQYRLTADEWSTDTEDWAIADEGVYVENPEFVYVKTDKEGKILWAIKIDGDIYYGAGCPQQVKDYIEEKIAELSLDEYEDIVAFLSDYLGSDTTLKAMIDGINAQIATKVDKEEGKSIIDAEYASTKSTVDNPEFLEMTLDAEDKVLEGIQKDGTKVIGGDLKVGGNATIGGDTKILGNMEVSGVLYKVVENPEYIAAWIDAEDKIIFGLKTDGKTYVGDADFLDNIEDIKAFLANITDKDIDWDALSSITATENPEYINIVTDSEDKILAGRTPDGAAFENVGFTTPKVSIDGTTTENIEDPEGRSEIITDVENKIISYRDSDGVKHEEVGIESKSVITNSLNLSEEGMTEFQQALKNSGFKPGGGGNWTDYLSNDGEMPVCIPEPNCAFLNILSDYNLYDLKKKGMSGAIEGVNYNVPTQVEFYDKQGNYFKKWVTMSGQGNSSMIFPKRNIAMDFFDSEANGDAFAIKFGEWVAQDSFHFKAYYNDAFRGASAVCYKLFKEIINTLDVSENRAYKKDTPHISGWSDGTENSKTTKLYNNYDEEALCFPDGFPVIIYQNGEFYGIYSWQIKKNRKNYHLDKKTGTNIHLDGVINNNTLFNADGDASQIDWRTGGDEGFEVRNPKSDSKPSKSYLFLQSDGTPYDADLNYGEIMGTDSTYYDASNANHRVCATVKEKILQLSTYIPELKSMELNSATTEEIRARIMEMFDVPYLIDYIIFIGFILDDDGWSKNWQWTTYNGNKWFVNPYDLDCCFGNGSRGNLLRRNYSGIGGQSKDIPTGWIWEYFLNDTKALTGISGLKERYAELRNKGILDANHITSMFISWVNRIGVDYWTLEFDKWNESPCHRDSLIDKEHWEIVGFVYNLEITYDPNTVYNIGDTVGFGHPTDKMQRYRFKCIKDNTVGYPPCTGSYTYTPIYLGYYDSPYRIFDYVKRIIANTDITYGYNQ